MDERLKSERINAIWNEIVQAGVVGSDIQQFARAIEREVASRMGAAAAQEPTDILHGFNRQDLADVAEGLEKGYARTVNVGDATGEGMGDTLLESSTAYAARFIRAALQSPTSAAQEPTQREQTLEGLLKRCARCLPPDHATRKLATDYLKREGFFNVLRAAQEPTARMGARKPMDPELAAAVREAAARGDHAVMFKGSPVFINHGTSEQDYAAQAEQSCPACGGSGHVDDYRARMGATPERLDPQLLDQLRRLAAEPEGEGIAWPIGPGTAKEIVRALAAAPGAAPSEALATLMDVTLDGDAAQHLRSWLGGEYDGEVSPVRLQLGDGHSGFGLYASAAEYPEDGALFLASVAQPPSEAPKPVAYVYGNDMLREVRWEPDTAAFDLPVGTKLYAAPIASLPVGGEGETADTLPPLPELYLSEHTIGRTAGRTVVADLASGRIVGVLASSPSPADRGEEQDAKRYRFLRSFAARSSNEPAGSIYLYFSQPQDESWPAEQDAPGDLDAAIDAALSRGQEERK